MWKIGMLIQGMWDLWMTEWMKLKLEEEREAEGRPHSRIVEIDFVRADDGWYGAGLAVGWKVWFMKVNSRIRARWYLWKLKRRKKR